MATTSPTSTRPFFVLWTGQSLSLIGSQAVQFALIWWLTIETGSATVLATASLVGLVPPVALGPFAGAIVDRRNRKSIMLWSDGVVALASLGLALLFLVDTAGIAAVYAVLFVRAVGGTFHQPAMLASTSLMVPERQLTRVQGLNQMVQGGLLVVSAPLGGLLLALFSMGPIMLVDCLTALIAIVPLLFINVPQPETAADDVADARPSAVRTVLRDIADGLGYLRERHGHLMIILIAAGINMFVVPAFALLPLLINEQLGGTAAQFAWVSSIFGVGMVAGGILLGVWGGFRRPIVTTLVGMVAFSVAILGVGLAPGIGACMIAMFAVGALVPIVNGPILSIIQATVAADYQGRVISLIGSLAGLTAPLGLLLAAPVAELVGVRAWFVAGAVACALMAGIGFLTPVMLRISDEAVPAHHGAPDPEWPSA